MNIPRFVQISTLTSYPASLLNRDDAGLAKRMRFGGAVRTRVSSQCLKRHWRIVDDAFSLGKVDPKLTASIRSREIFPRLIAPRLVAAGHAPDQIEAVLKEFMKALYGGKDKPKQEEETPDSGKNPLSRSEVVVLGEPEVEYLVAKAGEILNAGTAPGDAAVKDRLRGLLKNKDVADNFKALANGAGIDAAMFGRFVSGDPEARISAAVHVAHALTVHKDMSETDYFTAVDDLTTQSEGGSGHLGAAELTSGLYYTYVVVDVPQLVSNLTGGPSEKWLGVDRALAARTIKHLIHLMAKTSPGAKLGSTAPYDHAGLVLVEAGERQPRTLANAYLDPVPMSGPDVFGRTASAMAAYLAGMDGMYGCEETRWLASRLDVAGMPGFAGCARHSLPSLADAVEAAVAAGEA